MIQYMIALPTQLGCNMNHIQEKGNQIIIEIQKTSTHILQNQTQETLTSIYNCSQKDKTYGTIPISLKYSCSSALLAVILLLGSKQSIFWDIVHENFKNKCGYLDCLTVIIIGIFFVFFRQGQLQEIKYSHTNLFSLWTLIHYEIKY